MRIDGYFVRVWLHDSNLADAADIDGIVLSTPSRDYPYWVIRGPEDTTFVFTTFKLMEKKGK